MFSVNGAAVDVLLHTGHSVSLAEYLVRVIVVLITFGGVGGALFWVSQVVRRRNAAGGMAGEANEDGRDPGP